MSNPNNISPGGTNITVTPTVNLCNWPINSATAGTDTACTNGTTYYTSLWIPGNVFVNTISYLIGSVGGTDKVIASIYDSAGTLIANSAAAGATVGTTATVQDVALTAPIVLPGPGIILVGLTFNGTTAKFRSVPAQCSNGILGGSATQTFGTVTSSITVSTTPFTADKAPVVYLKAV
jgi:hypothetical protein